MKILKLKTAVLMVVMTIFVSFNSAFADNTPTNQIRSTITNQISYPVHAKENLIQGDVTLTFGLNDSGKVVVYAANSEQVELATYVKENFSKLDFSSVSMVKGMKYRIVITFNLL